MSEVGDIAAPDPPQGDSSEQRLAEDYLISRLGETLNVTLRKYKIDLSDGEWMEIDGACDSPKIFCEAWAHHGSPKAAQKNKVMTDALKLLYAEKVEKCQARKILLFGDRQAAQRFQGKSWMARALQSFQIEICIVELPTELRTAVLAAQKRQFR